MMEDFNEGIDGQQASRLRAVNLEQFQTLVKMHLSFELDRNTEDTDCITVKAKLKKWGLPTFSKKPKSNSNPQRSPEGVTLTKEGIDQVKRLIDYLSQESCIIQEGIFRRTGKLTRQQELKHALNHSLPLDLTEGQFSVHDCASVLKSYLAELYEPLLTDLHYPIHCQIVELCSSQSNANEARLLRTLQLLLLLLPPLNRLLLKHVLDLLNKTASFETSNKMNCDSLATLFTPHLMCPRKLPPEALHVTSQNLSVIVAFMIRKGLELFEIPRKLAVDIRAYWVEQEKKLLSPKKSDLNESISDTTGTAHTVFSFVDHQLTAQATASQDTQAALAQLYAYIQSMPESAKKRKLVKQFNKENGQGTPRHVKNNRTKSLSNSIKKHIFQKKISGHKKMGDMKLGPNVNRSNSEENILSVPHEKSLLPPRGMLSKSEDELSSDSFGMLNSVNLLSIQHMSSSMGSLDTPTLSVYKTDDSRLISSENVDGQYSRNVISNQTNLNEEGKADNSRPRSSQGKSNSSLGFDIRNQLGMCRHRSEPPDIYSSQLSLEGRVENRLFRPNSELAITTLNKLNIDFVFTRKSTSKFGTQYPTPKGDKKHSSISEEDKDSEESEKKINCDNCKLSPPMRNKLRNLFTAHTSTPSNLLWRNATSNECALTPIVDTDNSMSPITQSATKLSKAMQENIMTPRSRKPVVMLSTSNICNIPLQKDIVHYSLSTHSRLKVNLMHRTDCASIMEESPITTDTYREEITMENKENLFEDDENDRNFVSLEGDANSVTEKSSITSPFREYLKSRSVLDATSVDLSFESRPGDFGASEDFETFEQSIDMLNEEYFSDSLRHCLDGNNPESDTSGICSGSTNSANNSREQIKDISPRKRGTSLQRNDSKRVIKDTKSFDDSKTMHKEHNDPILNSVKTAETNSETAF